MNVTLLCNAGLALECDGQVLLIDLPNYDFPPFYPLPEDTWKRIIEGERPYDRVCGIYFSHDHPDHLNKEKLAAFRDAHSSVPVFMPGFENDEGMVEMGPFRIFWKLAPHAPLPGELPPHVISWVEEDGESLYLPADAALAVPVHEAFLNGRKACMGIWNSMYLSRPETRCLMHRAAHKNYVYHMPACQDDKSGIWRKCRNNLQRYPDELRDIVIMDRYPYVI